MTQTQDRPRTDSGGNKSGEDGGGGRNPVVDRLLSEAQSYVFNKATNLVGSLGERVTGAVGKIDSLDSAGLKTGVKSLVSGDSPTKAGLKAGGASLKDKVKGLFGGGAKGRGNKSVKATHINESIDIGLPLSTVYNQWTQFEEFGSFTKGVQNVEQKDEKTTTWRAKIAFSTRTWESTIKDQVPDERIAWTSEGAKATVDGVVTFHELAPNLTRVILELEYSPKGLFEKTGNIWRAQGRRVRLDLKHFRRFVMMRGEETGAWRGRIEDGEVTSSEEEDAARENEGGDQDEQSAEGDEQDEQSSESDEQDEQRGDAGGDEDEDEEEPASQPRARKAQGDGDGDGDRGGRRTRKEAASGGRRR